MKYKNLFNETEMLETQYNLSPKLDINMNNIINFYKNQELNLKNNEFPLE